MTTNAHPKFTIIDNQGEPPRTANFNTDNTATIVLEMPRELWTHLANAAYDNYRNPIHEIVMRLEQSFTATPG